MGWKKPHEGARGDARVVFETCGHDAPPRRVCDVCKTLDFVYVACSNECLRAHQRALHDAVPLDAASRAREAQANRNRRASDVRELFSGHREWIMSLIPPLTSGGRLCVLGAGRCDDLDLPRLADHFDSIHLVDLDGEAIEQARDRQPSRVKDAIVLHGGLDVSGLLGKLDEWGDTFPDDQGLQDAVSRAAVTVAAALAGPFEVTLSTCMLSQLAVPFRNAWAAPESTWAKLNAAITAVHVGVLARATAARGHCSLVVDVLAEDEAPFLAAFRGQSGEVLEAAVRAEAQDGAVVLQPEPQELLVEIEALGVAARSPHPRIIGPWIWDTGAALHLVYALSFRRP